MIAAEGEQKSSTALKKAADTISQSPAALQLRYLQVQYRVEITVIHHPHLLQTLSSISAEKNSTIIFPLPMEISPAFDMGGLRKRRVNIAAVQ